MDTTSVLVLLTSSLLVFGAAATGLTRGIPVCDQLAQARIGSLSGQMKCLMLSTEQMAVWLRLWCVAMVGLPAALWYSQLTLLIPVAIGLVFVAPKHILQYLIIRRRTLLRDQLVPATQGLANAVQAGLTLQQGLAEVNRDTPIPLKQEFSRILADYQRGRPLADAIEEVRTRLALESFTLFATAVQTALQRGGRVNEALVRISNSLREHQRIERKMEADTAAGRREVFILSLFPAVFGGMMYLMDANYTSLLIESMAGQCVLVVVIGLVYFGARWALKLMDIKN